MSLEHKVICSCGETGCPHLTADQRRDFLQGGYWMCRRLLTSPRLNKPQRELIGEQGYAVKDELEALGVVFTEDPDSKAAA